MFCFRSQKSDIWTRGYKTFFMLNSAEHEIYPAHKCIKKIVGILTFISRINTHLRDLKQETSLLVSILVFICS